MQRADPTILTPARCAPRPAMKIAIEFSPNPRTKNSYPRWRIAGRCMAPLPRAARETLRGVPHHFSPGIDHRQDRAGLLRLQVEHHALHAEVLVALHQLRVALGE